MAPRAFLKSASTQASPENSRMALDRMLTRYGAVGFSYAIDRELGEIRVEFIVPDTGEKNAPKVPVRLPISVHRIYDTLYGRPRRFDSETKQYVHNPKGYDAKGLLQAERVAWRNLVLWVDAALSAAAVGMQTISEAFFAHTLVANDDGRVERMADFVMRTGGALAPGVRALLPATTGTSQ